MTGLPTEAVTAAGNALRSRWLSERPNVVLPSFGLDPMEWAATALEAAAPHIAATERARACRIAASYLDGNVLREFIDEVGVD